MFEDVPSSKKRFAATAAASDPSPPLANGAVPDAAPGAANGAANGSVSSAEPTEAATGANVAGTVSANGVGAANGHTNGHANGHGPHEANGNGYSGPHANGGNGQHGGPLLSRSHPVPAPSYPSAGIPGESGPRLCRFSELLENWSLDAQAAYDSRVNRTPRGPLSGFAKLDRDLGGAFAPGLHIVHGQPGAGKTAFVLQVAASCGCPCLYLSCEMALLELLRRHTARVTNTYLGRLKSGELPPLDSLGLARRACQEAPLLALADGTRTYVSPMWLRDAALIAKGESKHLLIIVDSVHSWAEGAPVDASEYDTLNAALLSLRHMAHQLDCPILAVAERNRDSMKGGGLSAGAGTRKIEYGAETVLDLTREMDRREDFGGEVEVKLKFAKNRHGAAGKSIDFKFHGALQRFAEE